MTEPLKKCPPTWSLSAENGHFEVAEIRARPGLLQSKAHFLYFGKSSYDKFLTYSYGNLFWHFLWEKIAIWMLSINVYIIALSKGKR